MGCMRRRLLRGEQFTILFYLNLNFFLQILDVKYTPRVSNLDIGQYYMLDWTVTKLEKVERHGTPAFDYIYVAEKDNVSGTKFFSIFILVSQTVFQDSEDRKAVCNWTSNYIKARHRRFNKTVKEKVRLYRLLSILQQINFSAWTCIESTMQICSTQVQLGFILLNHQKIEKNTRNLFNLSEALHILLERLQKRFVNYPKYLMN